MAKKIYCFFFLISLSLGASLSLSAKTTGGVVVVQGRVVLPACTVNVINDGSNSNLTVNSTTNSTLTIPSIDYADLALASALGTEFGMSVGQVRTMSNAQFTTSLGRLYSNTGSGSTTGYAKISLRVQCPDANLLTAITYKVQEVNGNTSNTSLPFTGTTAASASTSLELHSFIRFENSATDNLLWNNFQNTAARALPNSGTNYVDLSSVNIITKKSASITNIGTANLNYSATQQLSFTYN